MFRFIQKIISNHWKLYSQRISFKGPLVDVNHMRHHSTVLFQKDFILFIVGFCRYWQSPLKVAWECQSERLQHPCGTVAVRLDQSSFDSTANYSQSKPASSKRSESSAQNRFPLNLPGSTKTLKARLIRERKREGERVGEGGRIPEE